MIGVRLCGPKFPDLVPSTEEMRLERIEPRLPGYLAFNSGPSQTPKSLFISNELCSSREDSTWLSRKLPCLQGQPLGCNRLEGGQIRQQENTPATADHSRPGGQLLTESAELDSALRCLNQ